MKDALLTRLRQGPLRTDQFAEVSASVGALKVRIHQLRRDGFRIETVAIPNGRYRPRAEYRLHEPRKVCPMCGSGVR